jgi:hypothetical protein
MMGFSGEERRLMVVHVELFFERRQGGSMVKRKKAEGAGHTHTNSTITKYSEMIMLL